MGYPGHMYSNIITTYRAKLLLIHTVVVPRLLSSSTFLSLPATCFSHSV